jgi:predicted  nucleic acid-binding Zn-ribbon protein
MTLRSAFIAADLAMSAQRKLVSGIEADIARLEERQAVLTQELQRPETYTEPGRAVALNAEMRQIATEIGAKTTAWETAAGRLEYLEREAAE